MTKALLLIDIQQGMFMLPQPPYRAEEVLGRIARLLERARRSGKPVFHVQHDGGPGHPRYARDSAGWARLPAAAPRAHEPVIEKRHYSSFQETDLDARLRAAGIDELVIAGWQTEYCVDTACRVAVNLGYRVALAADGHTTVDAPPLGAAQIIEHHNRTLGDGFVALAPADEIRF